MRPGSLGNLHEFESTDSSRNSSALDTPNIVFSFSKCLSNGRSPEIKIDAAFIFAWSNFVSVHRGHIYRHAGLSRFEFFHLRLHYFGLLSRVATSKRRVAISLPRRSK